MQYSEVKQGRVFLLRLEDGEIVHEVIERFARNKIVDVVESVHFRIYNLLQCDDIYMAKTDN